MSISNQNQKVSRSGDGTSHQFSFDFRIAQAADLVVIVRNDTTGVAVTKTLDTHFIIPTSSVNSASGGNILFKFNTGTSSDAHYSTTDQRPQSGETIIIKRIVQLTQGVDLQAADSLPADTLEDAYDKLTFGLQQVQEELGRALLRPATDTTSAALPDNVDIKGKFLKFNTSSGVAEGGEVKGFTGGSYASSTGIITFTSDDGLGFATSDLRGASTTATSSANGLMSASDKSKLDAVEASATADQTAAEIRTLVESASDSNVFTDADHSKLNAIEASATADQDAGEIRTLVEAATDSNVFTDADHTKLNGIEDNATIDQTPQEIKTAYESNSDTNAFTDADHSKLDGIEASATADQDASEIRALVESASDSNVFTDADHSKLNAIEAGATADQTAPDIRGLGFFDVSNDGAGSGLDADKLDGQEGSYYLDAGNLTGTVANARLDAQLQDVAGLAVTDSGFIVGDGSNFVLETGATVRTSLGLGTAATLDTGISNTNVPQFTSGVADDDFLRVNGTAIEGRSAAEVLSDIGGITASSTDTLTNKTIDASQLSGTVADARLPASISSDITGNAATATLASTTTVSDSTANTNFPVVFHDESNALLDDTGALRYNPSTGELLVPKLTVAGTTTTVDTVTMNAANAIVFEGATADAFETTLTIQDPTGSDKTITLPNATGTILLADGDGSSLTNVNATTLDSLDSTSFLRSDAADTKTSGNLNFSDNIELSLGSGDDLRLRHDGTDSYISNKTGDLYIGANDPSDVGGDVYLRAKIGESDTSIKLSDDANINFFSNGVETATFTSTNLISNANIVIRGSDNDIIFQPSALSANKTKFDFDTVNQNATLTVPNVSGAILTTGNSDAPTTTTSSGDADFVLVDDGGTMKKITPTNLGIGGGGMPTSGGTFTGDVTFNDSNIIFEGATNDAHETTLTVIDATSDNTISLPDSSGTVLLKDANDDVIIEGTDAGSGADPTLVLYRNSASPAAFDSLGKIAFKGKNSSGTDHTYFYMQAQASDETAGTEDGVLNFYHTIGGNEDRLIAGMGYSALTAYGNLKINASATYSEPTLVFEGATTNSFETSVKVIDPTSDNTIQLPDSSGTVLLKDANDDVKIESTDAGSASDPQFIFYRNSPSPAVNDALGKVVFKGNNSAAQEVQYGSILSRLVDATDGAEDGSFELQTISGGSVSTNVRIDASSSVGIRLLNGGEKNIRFDTGTGFDDNHIDLTPASATGARTVTLPDASGTVALQEQAYQAINAQTGTTYTTVLADGGKLVTLSNGSAITLTIPPNSSVVYPVGTKLDFIQIGAGQVTVAGGSGVTVNSTPTLKFRAQHSGASCIKIATDTWQLVGDLAAS